ncbi:MAG: TRAP transporter small permease [Gammaproteobacteria bacterium]|nr:TRAP transporter small permease [Gammaproteobacteria bacterium]
MYKIILRTYNALLATETFLLLFFLLTAILLACAQILLRNFFDSGIFWADSALRVLVLWIGMIGAMFATRKKKHIRIDILSRYLPHKLRHNLWRVNEMLTAIVCGIVAYYSIEFVKYEYADGVIAFANVPVWLCETIIPIAFIVMTLRYLVYSFLPEHLLNSEPSGINLPGEFK